MSNYRVNERIFMLDCARKYFTPKWIKSLIDELVIAGYNALSIHFSEDIGLRLESKQYPWLAGGDHSLCRFGAACGKSEDDGKYITLQEMADIVRYANAQGLDVIPSIDSPGHMNYAVKKYNAHFGTDIGNYFHKNGKISIVQGTSHNKEPAQYMYSRGIDITNPEAVKFAKSLYTEYGTFFYELGCRTIDIGGDELLGFGETIDDSLSKWKNLEHWDEYARSVTGKANATAYDAFLLYMNDIASLVRSIGYENVLMWNDDVYRSYDTGWTGAVQLDRDIDIQYWTPAANNGLNTARVYLDRGHNIYNFARYYSYYTLGIGVSAGLTPEKIEEEWNAYVFDQNVSENNPEAPDSRIKGGGFCLWSDNPSAEEEDEILEHIRPYFIAHGKKLLGK